MISFKCPCGKALKAAAEHAGKRAKCPACGAAVVVPHAPAATDTPPNAAPKGEARPRKRYRLDSATKSCLRWLVAVPDPIYGLLVLQLCVVFGSLQTKVFGTILCAELWTGAAFAWLTLARDKEDTSGNEERWNRLYPVARGAFLAMAAQTVTLIAAVAYAAMIGQTRAEEQASIPLLAAALIFTILHVYTLFPFAALGSDLKNWRLARRRRSREGPRTVRSRSRISTQGGPPPTRG